MRTRGWSNLNGSRSVTVYLLFVFSFALVGVGAAQNTWYVATDGDDDNLGDSPDHPFATVEQGLSACGAGDMLEIACGFYDEHSLVVTIPLTIQGSDPECPPVIDGGNASQILGVASGIEQVVIENIVFRGGTGEVLSIATNSCVLLMNCNIEGGQEYGDGLRVELAEVILEGSTIANRRRAVLAPGSGACIRFRNSHFFDNRQGVLRIFGHAGCIDIQGCEFRLNSGSEIISWGFSFLRETDNDGSMRTSISISDCEFENNNVNVIIGAYGNGVDIRDCIFIGNTVFSLFDTGYHVGSIGIVNCEILQNNGIVLHRGPEAKDVTISNTLIAGGSGPIFNNHLQSLSSRIIELNSVTIADNSGPILSGEGNPEFHWNNTIIYGNGSIFPTDPYWYDYFDPTVHVNCSDIFSNTGGDWIDRLAPQLGQNGNISLDPLFCGPDDGDYTLYDISPCAPGNHSDGADCGLIGRFDVACEVPPATLTISPLESGPINCDETVTLTFHYEPAFATVPVRGYELHLQVSPELSVSSGDVSFLTVPEDAEVMYFVTENAPNDLTLSYVILGDSGQIDTAADLFTLEVHGVYPGSAGTVQIASLVVRDLENQPIDVSVGLPAAVIFDCIPPTAVTDLSAAPDHEKVELSWQHDGVDIVHFVVFRGLWYAEDTETSAYPEYNLRDPNTIPTRPESYAEALASPEWDQAGTVPAGTLEFTDDTMTTGRGVYFYEVFALDFIENASPPVDTNERATNYWLGDIEPDGLVDITDADRFGDSFGVCVGDNFFDPECDFGPTDDYHRFGIPVPDGCVDFEDLMVFAMNFGRVEPGKSLSAYDPFVNLAWVNLADGYYALRLIGGVGIQGLRLRAVLPTGSDVTVQAGDLLHQQASPTFLRNVGQSLDVSVAVIGTGVGFAGTGDLFTVTAATEISGVDLAITARSFDNTELGISFDQVTGVEIPTAFSLSVNFPNPFNPVTTIRFALPEPQHVTLGVYGVDGKRVALLISESRAVGVHEVTWTGNDDHGRQVASGTYFYRIDAGSYRQVRKMVLMK